MGKSKAAYPLDFKTMFGVATMGLTQIIGLSLISTFLLLYITDYSGLYAGIPGKAAAIAAVMLIVARSWDAINDLFLGLVMDRSPRTKMGKFKPFMFWFSLISGVLIIALFNIPRSLSDNSRVVLLYVIYFMFSSAFTLLPITPLIQSLSKEDAVKTKLLISYRVVTIIAAVFLSFFIVIAIALGHGGTPNFGLAVIAFIVPSTILSMFGTALVKEGTSNVGEEKVRLKDAPAMFKANKPMLIMEATVLAGGFVWTIFFTAVFYYIKYALGVANFGTNSVIIGLLILMGMVLGVFVSQLIQKKVTPGMSYLISFVVSFIPFAVLWVINLAGPIRNAAFLYSVIFIALLGIGMNFIPGSLMTMECMDYNKYKLGKSMEGTISSITAFVNKIQAALSSAMIGWVLVVVGYNAVLYQNAANIPISLYSGLGVVLFAIPAFFSVLTILVTLFYPLLKKTRRDEMYAQIKKAKLERGADG